MKILSLTNGSNNYCRIGPKRTTTSSPHSTLSFDFLLRNNSSWICESASLPFASIRYCNLDRMIEWLIDWWGWSRWDQKDGISVLSLQSLGSANLGYKNLQSFWPVPSQLWFDIFSCYLSLIPNLHILLRSIPLTFLTGKLFQWDSKWGDDPYE